MSSAGWNTARAMALRRFGSLAFALLIVAGCGGASEGLEVGEVSSCTLAGASGEEFGVRRTTLTGTESGLEVEWTITGDLPDAGTTLFVVEATDMDEEERRELGVEYSDDAPVVSYVDGGAGRKDLEGGVERDAASVRAVFPADAVEALGDSFWWRSTLGVDGDVIDACPDPGDDPSNPELATFPN
jgi:hypothetical protein